MIFSWMMMMMIIISFYFSILQYKFLLYATSFHLSARLFQRDVQDVLIYLNYTIKHNFCFVVEASKHSTGHLQKGRLSPRPPLMENQVSIIQEINLNFE
jgi:hypothetical protein